MKATNVVGMEDSHSVHLYLPPADGGAPPVQPEGGINDIPIQPAGSTVTNDSVESEGPALLGVFDGHGGSTVAKFTGTTFHTRLAGLEAYKNGDYEVALKEVFMKTDRDLRADPNFFNDPSGCTAVVGLVTTDGRIIVANAGDSRSVLGYKGIAKDLSHDHKPTNAGETARITSAGGFVEFGRVNGNLALSRAIGDFEFKQNYSLEPEKQIVTCDPEITTHNIDGEEEFIVFACDGIWDCLTSQQVIDFIRRGVANGDDLGKICEDLMTKCLATSSESAGLGCDNMTVVIVALLNGRTPDEWQAWVKKRVEDRVGRETPEFVPDVFGPARTAAITGGGFRMAGTSGLANLAQILSGKVVPFDPAQDDEDEDDDDDDGLHIITPDELNAYKSNTPSDDVYMDDKAFSGPIAPKDVTDNLDSEEPRSSDTKATHIPLIVDEDGDSVMSDADSDITTTAAPAPSGPPVPPGLPPPISSQFKERPSSPLPPTFTSIGSPQVQNVGDKLNGDMTQHETKPAGDAYPEVAKVEGLMDTSESPIKL
ncbi:PP2Cc protein phosphatase [Tremella mesenterica]|uniref:protein-serine/threonine phosphatase n=1 Tax=Tremella mesenterica TaxID=5217 RepID=A0A4Q1BI83_TREME|nr:PP2Cc protein phosphatase [Tremella mesenterica]